MAKEDKEDEIQEINEDTIKQLAKSVAGGDDSDEEESSKQEVEKPDKSVDSGAPKSAHVEKLEASIDMLKEQIGSITDRLQNTSQSVGEIRQMFRGLEASFNNIEKDIDKLKTQVGDLEPEKIKKNLEEVTRNIENNKNSLNKLEERLERTEQRANNVQETLNDLGSLDNLIELNNDFSNKLSEIKEAERYIERLAQKSEKLNIQMKKKMDEYNRYKARVDSLDEKSSDMFKKLDNVSIEVQDSVKVDEMKKLKTRIKELEEQLKEYSKIAPLADMALPEPIAELREKRNDVEEFLQNLEEEYEKGEISTGDYERIKDSNEKKLEKINEELIDLWDNIEELIESGGDKTEEKESEETENKGSKESESVEKTQAEKEEVEEEKEEDLDSTYEKILDQGVRDIKEIVNSMNLDINKLIELEKEGENRESLIEWLEPKISDES